MGRLRAGTLARDRLEVAAIVGDEAALRARELEGLRRPLTAEELAKTLGVGTSTPGGWRKAGCPCIDRSDGGKVIRYDPAQVLAWLEAQPRRTGALPGTIRALRRALPIAAVRAAVVGLRLGSDPREPHPFLTAAEAWLEEPSPARVAAAQRAARDDQERALAQVLADPWRVNELLHRTRGLFLDRTLLRPPLVAWALGPEALAGARRWSVSQREGRVRRVDDDQVELTTVHEVLDRRSGRVVLSRHELEHQVIAEADRAVVQAQRSGVARIDVSPDGSHVVVYDHAGGVERIDLPG